MPFFSNVQYTLSHNVLDKLCTVEPSTQNTRDQSCDAQRGQPTYRTASCNTNRHHTIPLSSLSTQSTTAARPTTHDTSPSSTRTPNASRLSYRAPPNIRASHYPLSKTRYPHNRHLRQVAAHSTTTALTSFRSTTLTCSKSYRHRARGQTLNAPTLNTSR